MNTVTKTASEILRCWQSGEVLATLDDNIRPVTADEGYAIQAELARLRGEPIVGWKIAATSEAGRQHIKVDRPLAGRLYKSTVFENESNVSLVGNRMRVAEAEIVLSLQTDLPPLERPRTESDVAAAVSGMHAGLEFPDSRFEDFTSVGTASLIADNACARHFILGPLVTLPSDLTHLALLPTEIWINDRLAISGVGSDALGGSLTALTWLINTVNALGITLGAGEFVTTGVTGKPVAISPGDRITVNIGSVTSVSGTVS